MLTGNRRYPGQSDPSPSDPGGIFPAYVMTSDYRCGKASWQRYDMLSTLPRLVVLTKFESARARVTRSGAMWPQHSGSGIRHWHFDLGRSGLCPGLSDNSPASSTIPGVTLDVRPRESFARFSLRKGGATGRGRRGRGKGSHSAGSRGWRILLPPGVGDLGLSDRRPDCPSAVDSGESGCAGNLARDCPKQAGRSINDRTCPPNGPKEGSPPPATICAGSLRREPTNTNLPANTWSSPGPNIRKPDTPTQHPVNRPARHALSNGHIDRKSSPALRPKPSSHPPNKPETCQGLAGLKASVEAEGYQYEVRGKTISGSN